MSDGLAAGALRRAVSFDTCDFDGHGLKRILGFDRVVQQQQ